MNIQKVVYICIVNITDIIMKSTGQMLYIRAVHPGCILKKELKARGISQKDFAQKIEMKPSQLSEVITGKRDISISLAKKLEASLGISAKLWLDLQAKCDCDKRSMSLKDDEESLAEAMLNDYDSQFDIRTIFRRLNLFDYSNRYRLDYIRMTLRIDQFNTGYFKRSAKTGLDNRMIATWVLIAKHIVAEKKVIGKYDENKFDELCDILTSVLHRNVDTINLVEKILSEYGIKFAIVEKVDKASIDGFSFLESGVPAIVLTRRFNRIDNFAFALMHEVGHLKLHLNEANDSELSLADDSDSLKEQQANTFAANKLISDWSSVPKVKLNPFAIQKAYTRWAIERGYNQWIVLGRIAYETGMYKFATDKSREVK